MPVIPEYREKLRESYLAKSRNFLLAYYHRKISIIGSFLKKKDISSLESLMKRFSEKGVDNPRESDEGIDTLCILLSDLDPSLYDLNHNEKIKILNDIYEELFKIHSSPESIRKEEIEEKVSRKRKELKFTPQIEAEEAFFSEDEEWDV